MTWVKRESDDPVADWFLWSDIWDDEEDGWIICKSLYEKENPFLLIDNRDMFNVGYYPSFEQAMNARYFRR